MVTSVTFPVTVEVVGHHVKEIHGAVMRKTQLGQVNDLICRLVIEVEVQVLYMFRVFQVISLTPQILQNESN